LRRGPQSLARADWLRLPADYPKDAEGQVCFHFGRRDFQRTDAPAGGRGFGYWGDLACSRAEPMAWTLICAVALQRLEWTQGPEPKSTCL